MNCSNKRVALVLSLLFLFCQNNQTEKRSSQRIISLVPSVTETIFALGGEDKLVGVTTYCNYPEEAKKKQKVGDFSNPSIERIMFLRPDLVFATAPEQSKIINKLKTLGIDVITVQPESYSEIIESIKEIGSLLGKEKRAEEILNGLEDDLKSLKRLVEKIKEKRKVYIELDCNPLFTVGKNSFLNELIELSGGENIAGYTEQTYFAINPEIVVKSDPEVIILAYPSEGKSVKRRIGWKRITAVKENRVYSDIDWKLITSPGPRFTKACFELYKRFYPEK